jgi:2-polyprenyl-3-methyl-5-hydroxy-6-metoxy-1,4-benzoquinol methylase
MRHVDFLKAPTFLQVAYPDFDTMVCNSERALDAFRLNILPRLPSSRESRVLDFGCGAGLHLYALREEGYLNLVGAEVRENMVEWCSKAGFEVVFQPSGQCPTTSFPEEGFEAILMIQVIEHIPMEQVVPTLDGLRRCLAQGGELIVQTTNAVSLAGHADKWNDMTHTFGYTERSLLQALEFAGFRTIVVEGGRSELASALRARKVKRAAWQLAQRGWFALRRIAHLIEMGTDAPRIYTKNLLAVATRDAG